MFDYKCKLITSFVGATLLLVGRDAYAHVVNAQTGEGLARVSAQVYVPSSIAVYGEMAYLGNHEGGFFGIDIPAEEIIWQFMDAVDPYMAGGRISGFFAISNNKALIGDENGRVKLFEFNLKH